jgi:hypothetical protein
MRFPRVSSRTAVVTEAHLRWLLSEPHAERAQALVLRLDVGHRERGERDPVSDEPPPSRDRQRSGDFVRN